MSEIEKMLWLTRVAHVSHVCRTVEDTDEGMSEPLMAHCLAMVCLAMVLHCLAIA